MAAAYIHPPRDSVMETVRHEAQAWHCPLYEVRDRGPVDPRTLRTMFELCRRLRVTVWHAHDHKSNALGIALRYLWPMRLISTAHGWVDSDWRSRLYHRVDHWTLKQYDRVIAVSYPIAEELVAHGVKPRRIVVIPNAIDPSLYQREKESHAVRQAHGIAPDACVMGVVGRLSAEKGVDRALRLLRELRSTRPEVELHIVGDGPERVGLHKLANELGVAEAVRWWGYQADPKAFYEMMDMLLVPSYREGLPNAALEAMAMSLPVAAADVGAMHELLDDGRCGVLLDPTVEDGWAGHVLPLVVSGGRRAQLGRMSRERIELKYSFQRRMEKMKALYKRMLRLPGRPEAAPRRRAA